MEGLEQLAGCPLVPALGKYHCPVLFAVFTNSTHIVAIRTTGNVYAYEGASPRGPKCISGRTTAVSPSVGTSSSPSRLRGLRAPRARAEVRRGSSGLPPSRLRGLRAPCAKAEVRRSDSGLPPGRLRGLRAPRARAKAVEQLNIKAKNFRDLLTDEPFSRQDVITLQVGVPFPLPSQGHPKGLGTAPSATSPPQLRGCVLLTCLAGVSQMPSAAGSVPTSGHLLSRPGSLHRRFLRLVLVSAI
ncbi:hypothetical protein MC885_013266 [Smutsia gigantea]|nr:hypothetical protein MC885_013266 [Smutsia gigantea]